MPRVLRSLLGLPCSDGSIPELVRCSALASDAGGRSCLGRRQLCRQLRLGYELAVGEQSVSATVIDYADLHLDLSLGAITPAPQQLSTFPPDPYAGRTPPAAARCTYWFWSGTNAQPGTCCGGMTLIGSGTVTFAPGIYVIDGGLLVGWRQHHGQRQRGDAVFHQWCVVPVQRHHDAQPHCADKRQHGRNRGVVRQERPEPDPGGGTDDAEADRGVLCATSTINLVGIIGNNSCFQFVALALAAAGIATFNHNCVGTGVSDPSVAGSGYQLVE